MNTPPYEFCALKFLDLWRAEEPLHRDMQDAPSASQIRRALKHFRIARTFKGLSDALAEQISEYLVDVSNGEGSYQNKVMELTKRFKDRFRQSNLSAASKLLWLRNRNPYVIYDARAVKALHRLGHKRFENYTAYCESWQKEYLERSDEIVAASHGLLGLPRKYTAAFMLGDQQLSQIVHSPWFCERVFDIYLWELGDKDREPTH